MSGPKRLGALPLESLLTRDQDNKTVMNWISGIPDPQEDVTTTIHNGPSAQIPTVTQGFSVLTGPQTGLSKKDKQISSQSTQLSQEEEVFGGLRAPIMKGFDSKGQTSKPIVTEGVASMVTTSPALTPGRHMLRRYSSTQNLRGSASRAEVSTGHKKAGGFANNS